MSHTLKILPAIGQIERAREAAALKARRAELKRLGAPRYLREDEVEVVDFATPVLGSAVIFSVAEKGLNPSRMSTLVGQLPRLAATVEDEGLPATECRRMLVLLDFTLRTTLPLLFEAYGHGQHAMGLRESTEIRSIGQIITAHPVIKALYEGAQKTEDASAPILTHALGVAAMAMADTHRALVQAEQRGTLSMEIMLTVVGHHYGLMHLAATLREDQAEDAWLSMFAHRLVDPDPKIPVRVGAPDVIREMLQRDREGIPRKVILDAPHEDDVQMDPARAGELYRAVTEANAQIFANRTDKRPLSERTSDEDRAMIEQIQSLVDSRKPKPS